MPRLKVGRGRTDRLGGKLTVDSVDSAGTWWACGTAEGEEEGSVVMVMVHLPQPDTPHPPEVAGLPGAPSQVWEVKGLLWLCDGLLSAPVPTVGAQGMGALASRQPPRRALLHEAILGATSRK